MKNQIRVAFLVVAAAALAAVAYVPTDVMAAYQPDKTGKTTVVPTQLWNGDDTTLKITGLPEDSEVRVVAALGGSSVNPATFNAHINGDSIGKGSGKSSLYVDYHTTVGDVLTLHVSNIKGGNDYFENREPNRITVSSNPHLHIHITDPERTKVCPAERHFCYYIDVERANIMIPISSGQSGNRAPPVAPPPADTTAPVITLNGQTPVTITLGDDYTDAGATCTDDTGANIIMSYGVPVMATPGNYTITYTCTDSARNTAAPVLRTVIVEAPPVEEQQQQGSSGEPEETQTMPPPQIQDSGSEPAPQQPQCITTDSSLLATVAAKMQRHADTGRADLKEMFTRSHDTMLGNDNYTTSDIKSRPDKQQAKWQSTGPNALWQSVYAELDRLESCRAGQ